MRMLMHTFIKCSQLAPFCGIFTRHSNLLEPRWCPDLCCTLRWLSPDGRRSSRLQTIVIVWFNHRTTCIWLPVNPLYAWPMSFPPPATGSIRTKSTRSRIPGITAAIEVIVLEEAPTNDTESRRVIFTRVLLFLPSFNFGSLAITSSKFDG